SKSWSQRETQAENKTQNPDPLELGPQENQTHSNHNIIKIIHQNINWLSNKVDRLAHLLNSEKPDLLIVTEHGLSQENLATTCLEGYSLAGGFARKDHIKGGVAGYVKKGQEKEITLIETSGPESEL
ncbi:hypothetical protein J6590_108017, partial [Homalodisca vitripennis]